MDSKFTEEQLTNLYVNEKKSISEISRIFNCSFVKVSNALKKLNIPKNPEFNSNKKHEILANIKIEEFQKLFIDQCLSYEEIAKIFNCSARQIKRLNLEKFKIKRDKEMTKKFIEKHAGPLKEKASKMRDAYKLQSCFENPSLNPEIQEKRRINFNKKYGVNNPFQLENVKEKSKETLSKKYGKNITNISQVASIKQKNSLIISNNKLSNHTDTKTIEILHSKEKLKEFILSLDKEKRNYSTASKILKIDETTLASYIKKYNLLKIMEFKYPIFSYENEIVEFLKSLNITNIERNSKKYLDGKEIDIFIPEKKIGIEFNGNYWHSEAEKEQRYHQKKSLLAELKGIFLYHIFEYEWNNPIKKEKIKNQLKHLLIPSFRKIYARKCLLKIIIKNEKREFLNQYHLQGNDRSLYEFGLFYENELVMVMTFCHARFTKNHKYELSRMCTKADVTVVGGAEKLFKYFVNNYLKINEKICTYNEISKTRGNVYPKIGFTKLRISKPNYIWWKSNNPIITRYMAQGKNEIKKMHGNKYLRIFDSGNNVWTYEKV